MTSRARAAGSATSCRVPGGDHVDAACRAAAPPAPRRCRRPAGRSRARRSARAAAPGPSRSACARARASPSAPGRKRMFARRAWKSRKLRARADLEPLAAARRPDLEVVLHRGGERRGRRCTSGPRGRGARAAGRRPRRRRAASAARRRTSPARTNFTISTLSNWWPRLMPRTSRPGRHLLAAEARRVGDVVDRQRVAVEDLVAVEVGHRHLGGRDQPEVLLGVAVEVVAELRQVAGADQALALHHRGRVDLGVAVLAGVQVEHPGDQRALQPRARAAAARRSASPRPSRRARSR